MYSSQFWRWRCNPSVISFGISFLSTSLFPAAAFNALSLLNASSNTFSESRSAFSKLLQRLHVIVNHTLFVQWTFHYSWFSSERVRQTQKKFLSFYFFYFILLIYFAFIAFFEFRLFRCLPSGKAYQILLLNNAEIERKNHMQSTKTILFLNKSKGTKIYCLIVHWPACNIFKESLPMRY